jgi:hypothetical protein
MLSAAVGGLAALSVFGAGSVAAAVSGVIIFLVFLLVF